MALTTSKTYYRQQFGPLMPDVYVAPYPYCLHCKVRQASASGADWYKVRCLPEPLHPLTLSALLARHASCWLMHPAKQSPSCPPKVHGDS